MITLADVVLRDDLDPRLGDRDDDLIQQYADIFDALPPIEINQHNELIDGWHRVRAAERAKKTAIAYVVVETKDDDDLGDKMWAANLKHGAQYSREQRQTHGLKLHERGLAAKEIADRVGVGASSVYRWTKEYREKVKQERDSDIQRLRDEGKTQQEIADELGIDRSTVARNVQDSQMGISHEEAETHPSLSWSSTTSRNQRRATRQLQKRNRSQRTARILNQSHRQNRYQSRRILSKSPRQSWGHSPRNGRMIMSPGSRHLAVNG